MTSTASSCQDLNKYLWQLVHDLQDLVKKRQLFELAINALLAALGIPIPDYDHMDADEIDTWANNLLADPNCICAQYW